MRLLNRTTRAVSATEAGQAYFDRLRPLLDEFDSLDTSIRDASHAPRGRLRVTTAPLTFGAMELAPALNMFALRYAEIELDVSFSDRVLNPAAAFLACSNEPWRGRRSSLRVQRQRGGSVMALVLRQIAGSDIFCPTSGDFALRSCQERPFSTQTALRHPQTMPWKANIEVL